jgi:hypothetical protein
MWRSRNHATIVPDEINLNDFCTDRILMPLMPVYLPLVNLWGTINYLFNFKEDPNSWIIRIKTEDQFSKHIKVRLNPAAIYIAACRT